MEKRINNNALIAKGSQLLFSKLFLVFFIGISISITIYNCNGDNCSKTFPNPEIKFDHKDDEGRIYIPVVNWSDYTNKMFREAPELPPCGTNTKSSRTWVDIYNADNDARIYGFCAFNSNDDLKSIWFKPDTPNGNVYVILNDRACNKSYKSNTISFGECADTYTNPEIKYDHKDDEGRIYIPVVNWSDYPNELFREAPELPPCGANTNSSRAWVDIYNADNDARIYGFCAFNSNDDLKGIWFKPGTPNCNIYIIINDRACNKSYKSNTIGL